MKKLNKAQTFKLITELLATAVELNAGAFKKDQGEVFLKSANDMFKGAFGPKTGGGASTKVNDAGEVYCNYFETYMPATSFNKKLGKPDSEGVRHEVFKANSIRGEQILRKLKVLRGSTESMATEYLRAKKIDEDQFNIILDALDDAIEEKYAEVKDTPTVPSIFKSAGVEL